MAWRTLAPRMPDTVIIVPCYDEAERLDPEVFLSGLAAEPRLSLRFVDDGSRDATLDVLEALRARSPDRIAVTRCRVNGGKAEAVRRGIQDAFADGVAFVGYWDADLATPLDEIGHFLAALDARPQLRVVLGSRVRLLGRSISRKTTRHIYGRVFATLVSTMLSLHVYDTQCGAKLFRVTPELEIAFSDRFMSRWVFDVELLVRLMREWDARGIEASDVILEQPLLRWQDVHGSKVTPVDGIKAIGEVAAIGARYRSYLAGRRRGPGWKDQ